MWKLAVEDDQGNKTVVNLVRDEYSVGRGDQNTVRLTERNISRKHALLRKNGTAWILEDLHSYNGCFVNGVRVSEHSQIDHGDLVQLGDYRLVITDEAATRVESGEKTATIPSVPKSQALLGQPDRLVMVAGPTPGAEYPLTTDRLVIGRGEECDVSVNHGSVSRVHAEIHSLGDGRYEIIDKESANGVRINGVELKQSLIDARDLIELGDVQLKFIPQGVVYALADESQRIDLQGAGPISAMPVSEARRGAGPLPPVVKIGAAIAGLGLLVILGMLIFGRGAGDGDPAVDSAMSAEHSKQVLAEAKALLAKGDTEGAHNKLAALPADSNLRKSAEFRDIEAQWADALFEAADAQADPAAKRSLLDRIAKATTVDDGRRKLAADKIAKLDGEAVDVSELEKEQARAAGKSTIKNGLVRKNPFGDTPSEPAPSHAPAPKKSGPAPKPKGPSAKDLATSGDRSNAARAKAMYEAKANSGRATLQDLRMLRALCGQLGDSGCRARASALIRQKKAAGGP